MTKLEYLFKQYENVLFWKQHAQNLSRFALAINTAIVGLFNGLYFLGSSNLAQKINADNLPAVVLLMVCSISLVCSFLFLFRSIWANHKSRPTVLNDNEKMWFFGHVATIPREKYYEAIENWTEEDAISSLQSQIHILSGLLSVRFNSVNLSFTCTGISLICLFFIGLV